MNTNEEPHVLRDDKNHVAWLTLNRPKQMNALSREVISELLSQLDKIAADTKIRVVVLSGAGVAFSAGHDLKQMMEFADAGNEMEIENTISACTDVMLKIQGLPQPVIASIQGTATAAGCQLVAACDIAIAGSHARFATSGINLGLFCSTPLVQLSRSVGKSAALEMAFTGKFINAEDALRIGLVSRCVGPEVLDAEVENIALEIASKSPAAIKLGKELFYKQRELGIDAAYALAMQAMNKNMQNDDAREGIKAFVEKRTPPKWHDLTKK
ncbi:MAG: enoyl-CoA hydratase [Rhodospirillaceae bacterium]|nr:enoyl-CoA hydratase [Rhodospirillaceae bacterium]